MDKNINAKGLACPKPVILTKKELDGIDSGSVTTEVDNIVAKENLSKLANSMNLEYTIKDFGNEHFAVTIIKGFEDKVIEEKSLKKVDSDNMVIVIQSDEMGKGSEALGKLLMKSFIYTVKETKPYPRAILFYNSGVKLTCKDSDVLEDLIHLEKEGVEIISCGTCLDFYSIKDFLMVGSISNMYTIYETMKSAANTIVIG